jgi:hypothetical protein
VSAVDDEMVIRGVDDEIAIRGKAETGIVPEI